MDQMDRNQKTKRKLTLLPCAIIQILSAVAIAVFSRFGMWAAGAVFTGVVAAMLSLQILASSDYWYLLSITLSLCVSFILGDVVAFAICFFAVPAGIILAVLIKKKQSKMNAVVALNILYIILFSLLFIVFYLLAGNKFSFSAIINYFSESVDSLNAAFRNEFSEAIEKLAVRSGVSSSAIYAETDSYFATIKYTLPAIFTVFFGIVAYITASIFKLGTRISKCELLLPDPKWEVLPSFISAIVYLVAYLIYSVAALFSGSVGVTEVVCNNIIMILYPLMVLMGLKWLFSRRRSGAITAIFVVAIIFFSSFALPILSFIGVWNVFRRNEFNKSKKNKNMQ